jgi:5-methylcytosine-specific restriction endonuclease McrA
MESKYCKCGCGGEVKPGKTFLQGHYLRVHPIHTKRQIKQEIVKCACGCGKDLDKFDKKGRERKFISGHNFRIQIPPMKDPAVAARVGKKLKGRVRTEEHRKNLSKALKGKKRSDAFKKNRSEYMKKHSPLLNPKSKAKFLKTMQSEEHRKKLSRALKGRIVSQETRDKISTIHKGKKGLVGNKNPMFGISGENAPSWKGGVIKDNIALYETYVERISYAETTRRDPDNDSLLQVKCIYCDKWYNPTRATVKSRITALNSSSASENRFYCSSKCKNECPIFHQHKYPKGYKTASSREVQSELRKLVFHRDNWECIRCGATAQLHCHHITGVELNPVESADIDNCITFCKKCHKWIHTEKGCRYVDLRRKECGQSFNSHLEELKYLLNKPK